MPKVCDSSGLSSELTLTSLTRPLNDSATFSIVGASARHGPHQGAQKSTTTGSVFRGLEDLAFEGGSGDVHANYCTARPRSWPW